MERGAKTERDCETCKKPFPLEENFVIFEIYYRLPLLLGGMEAVMDVNILAVDRLCDLLGISEDERLDVLDRLLFYRAELSKKET